ncbi:hypothetical protein ACFVUN_21570 [Kitasatospora griseola]|uniref:hypothetical protein n=1 Tax=Kitasatospora griseola TaxID=2064 RepID=UPI0036D869DD
MSRRLVTVLAAAAAAAAAAFAVVGCTAATTAPQAAAPTSAGPGPACSAAPSPTESWLGGWVAPLPDEIRCLPHIDHGAYSHTPPAADVQEGGQNAVTVTVTPDTTPDQTLALCLRITELGYGLDGPHQVAFLSVGNGEETGHYTSMPGQAPCLKIR